MFTFILEIIVNPSSHDNETDLCRHAYGSLKIPNVTERQTTFLPCREQKSGMTDQHAVVYENGCDFNLLAYIKIGCHVRVFN
jgi:hypothetical protein